MYQMKMAQRNSSTTAPTSTTCAQTGITSFADGGKAGIGDCGGGGDAGVNGAGGDEGQAEGASNLAMTLPPALSTGSCFLPAVKHLRATDAGNMILGAASLGAMLAVSGVNLGPLA